MSHVIGPSLSLLKPIVGFILKKQNAVARSATGSAGSSENGGPVLPNFCGDSEHQCHPGTCARHHRDTFPVENTFPVVKVSHHT
jgi:hypothetical protein